MTHPRSYKNPILTLPFNIPPVGIVGASGETGQSIVEGLLSSSDPKFEVTALTRPESLTEPVNVKLKSRGVSIVPVSLSGPQEKLVLALSGIDVVISAIYFGSLAEEIPLANAAKVAGVKRFVQSAFMIVVPPRGVVDFQENLNHIQKIRLPYTYIDVGWWFQVALPRLSSGRIDSALPATQPDQPIGLDGNVPSALADIKDVGRYVARIIADPRTLNKKVHIYNEVYTRNQVYDLLEKLSGEKLERGYISEEDAYARVEEARAALKRDPTDGNALAALTISQLFFPGVSVGTIPPNTLNTSAI